MSESGKWHRYIDDVSEHYEITDTSRERAEIGDGHLFRMGDKDDANALADYLNSLEASLTEVKEQKQDAVNALKGMLDSAEAELAEVKAERDRLQRVVEVVSLARDDAEVLQANAEAQVRELTGLLRRIEHVNLGEDTRCPVCFMSDMGGHLDDCALVEALNHVRGEGG